MRIIAGKYKNRKIITEIKSVKLDKNKIRPTTEKLRAAVFNILPKFFESSHEDVLYGKKVIDLFCGVGSFGLEAISRGALKVTFIDNQRNHLELVKLNLEKIGCSENANLYCKNAINLHESKETYDVVYIDPPYALNITDKVIDKLLDNGWVNENSIIIVESDRRIINHSNIRIKQIDKRTYNNTAVSFYVKCI